MAYLGYKIAAYRQWKREQEELKKWKEAEKVRIIKAKQTKNLLKAIVAHVFIAIVLITIYYLLWHRTIEPQKVRGENVVFADSIYEGIKVN